MVILQVARLGELRCRALGRPGGGQVDLVDVEAPDEVGRVDDIGLLAGRAALAVALVGEVRQSDIFVAALR